MALKNQILRSLFRLYPFQKGRYRLMMLFEKHLDRKPVSVRFLGNYKLSVDLQKYGLERTFYFFMPEIYERETQKFIRENVKKGMVAMDVGAHHGLFTLSLASGVGATGRVYSFEPEAENFSRLQMNVDQNRLSQVEPLRMALSDHQGNARLYLNGDSSAGHSLQEAAKHASGGTYQQVETDTLDHFLESRGIERVDVLKMDAEGSEHLILKGASRSLSSGKIKKIICEVHSSHKKTEVGQDRVRKMFYAHDYRSFILNPKLSGRPYLSRLMPQEPVTGLQNLLFIKRDLP